DVELKCDILIFVTTRTERAQLESVANEFEISFEEKQTAELGSYFKLGKIGLNRVCAVQTNMGSFFHKASAHKAIELMRFSGATSIIQVGMAFGIDSKVQNYGDVLISRWIFPYDYRIVEENSQTSSESDSRHRYLSNYKDTRRFQSKDSLLKIFELEKKKSHDFKIHIGGMLSGGARMRSQTFLRELLVSVTNSEGPGGYVGGEMEGVGLLAVSDKANPVWIVVKGISDFADQNQAVEVKQHRELACRNSIRLVFLALLGNNVSNSKVGAN
ncbi:MAG: hypothetical protein ACKO85_09850, partial [Isosphaeraceae bacterium]